MSNYSSFSIAYAIVAFVISAGLAFIPANIAKSKGRNFWTWWIYGLFIFIVALIHSLLLKDESGMAESETIKEEEAKRQKTMNIAMTSGGDPTALLKRAELFLEDGEWETADAYAESALNGDPENPLGYLYKVLAEQQFNNIKELLNANAPLMENANFKKALRFADEDLKTQLLGIAYSQAVNKMTAAESYEDYIVSAELLENIGYNDSADLSAKCRALAAEVKDESLYNSAIALMESGKKADYTKAIEIFNTIPDFKDSKEQIYKCENSINDISEKERIAQEEAAIKAKKNKKTLAIVAPIVIAAVALAVVFVTVIMPNNKYNSALKALDDGDYFSAYESLKELGDYKDSKEKIITAKSLAYGVDFESLYNASAGEIVEFGNYEQDNNSANGKEPIQWIVLEKEDDKLLLISESILDAKTFNNKNDSATWETCSLRNWLNNDFYNLAFDEGLQSFIISTDLYTQGNHRFVSSDGKQSNYGENSTTDNVFLLSLEEAEKYYASKSLHEASFTDYAKSQKLFFTDGAPYWWLRTNGFGTKHASFVYKNNINFNGGEICYRKNGVRPAIWVNIEP